MIRNKKLQELSVIDLWTFREICQAKVMASARTVGAEAVQEAAKWRERRAACDFEIEKRAGELTTITASRAKGKQPSDPVEMAGQDTLNVATGGVTESEEDS